MLNVEVSDPGGRLTWTAIQTYSGSLLANSDRIRGVFRHADRLWVCVGYGGSQARPGVTAEAHEIVSPDQYTGPTFANPKRHDEYSGPEDFYAGRLVRYRGQRYVITTARLKITCPLSLGQIEQAAM